MNIVSEKQRTPVTIAGRNALSMKDASAARRMKSM
jgi:hypothetical protein